MSNNSERQIETYTQRERERTWKGITQRELERDKDTEPES